MKTAVLGGLKRCWLQSVVLVLRLPVIAYLSCCLPVIPYARAASGGAVQRVMVIDLDVHQGNGVERDKLHHKDKDMYIVDMYNCKAFPWDTAAKKAINAKVRCSRYSRTADCVVEALCCSRSAA